MICIARPFTAVICLLLVMMSVVPMALAAPDNRPNIIIIMSDDMGYSDIGCYGSEINTPNLDRLATEGLRFTQFYNTARCCPTRGCILTGLYPHEAGIGHMMDNRHLPGYQGDLSPHALTIAQVLKTAGYRTYMCGKWHVTPYRPDDAVQDRHNWPLQRGFDHFYGTIHGAGSYYDPSSLVRDNEFISPYADPEYQPDTYYYTDAITHFVGRYIKEHHEQHPDQPFFMYVTYTAAHWPMQALPRDIAKYKGKYDAGYGPIRRARFERMKKLGLIDANWEMSPQAGQWEKVKDKAWEARNMEVYAAMIDRMDQGIGRIVETLEQTGDFENTLMLFLQDNGGCAEGMGRGSGGRRPKVRPNEPGEPMSLQALQTQMVPEKTRDGWPMRQGVGVMAGLADTYIGYGRSWANVSNTPFREYKHWVHEGGISTPLIAHWPRGIPASRQGKLERQPGHLIDLMATCVDLARASYPETYDGQTITPLEGVSLAPAFHGDDLHRPNPLFWEHEGNCALRIGKWKIVRKGNNGKHFTPWSLYDLDADRTEMHDLADQYPDRVKDMVAQWEQMALRVKAKPWPWGDDDQ